MDNSKIKVEITHNQKPDVLDLIALYSDIGWNQDLQRTASKLDTMLDRSLHFICAYHNHKLIGFGRILGDPFVAQLLDVITHPDYRRRGIATTIVRHLLNAVKDTHNSVIVIDGSGYKGFYEKFGFELANPSTDKLMYLNYGSNNYSMNE